MHGTAVLLEYEYMSKIIQHPSRPRTCPSERPNATNASSFPEIVIDVTVTSGASPSTAVEEIKLPVLLKI